MAVPQGWIEVQEPVLMTFDTVGTSIRGTLLDLFHEQLKDEDTKEAKPVLTARLELSNGNQMKFRPSYDLRQKLGRRHIGKELHIVFDSLDQVTASKGNAMKKFRVFVNPDTTAETPFVATDDDLPSNI